MKMGEKKDMKSFANGEVRILQHEKSIVGEDNLDKRWEDATGEVVDEVIFFSKHTAVSNRPALTVHPIGIFLVRANLRWNVNWNGKGKKLERK